MLEASWGSRVSSPSACGDAKVERFRGLADAASDGLARIQELEAAKARIESQLLEAYGFLHTVQEQQFGAVMASRGHGKVVPVSVDQVVAKEIALATGLGEGEVSRRLHLATRPRRHRLLRAELAAGRTSLSRALAVAEATASLPDAAAADVESAVLAPARDGGPVSAATFRQRLRRCVLAADSRGADERRASAQASRTAYGRLTEDGMGVLTLVMTAERVVGILDRADAAARALRATGDPRTLDQLRSDFIGDTLLSGRPDGGPTGLQVPPDVTPGVTSGAEPGWPGMPAARVWIVVPFAVAAGTSEAPCELPGHGWVTAAHARQIMTAPGSVWQRLAVDVDTGRALELSTESYTPTAAMVAAVRARDGVCRGPGCEVPAGRCDLDHEVPWPAGPTTLANLHAKHRRCHNTKTSGLFRSRLLADGGLAWTTLAGREYVTYPKDWLEALRDGAEPARPTSAPDDSPPF
ncbi:HNH endonuclease signature motif containing protein [Intrasporangium oryzae]|uniref:HNH endonuclease signature motif containing protein n=1 Tax=Intrasporangium oryzae TaxID=412687 RepID=UPI0012F84BE0|nr:HNH endonuclease signature motif containing protein [Intrasporangium oryzae]